MRVPILNTYIDNLSYDEAVSRIIRMAKDDSTYCYVVTPNVDDIVNIEKDPSLKQIFNNADLNLADGMPLVKYAKKNGLPITDKISGRLILPMVCEQAEKEGLSVFLLGAAEGVAELAKLNLERKYNSLIICGTYSPPIGFDSNDQELLKIKSRILETKPDILILAMGGFKQQRLIASYKDDYKVPVSLCLGAAIDFAAGVVEPIPDWASNRGIGWLFRIKNEPKRMIKRYIVDAIGFMKILRKYSE